MHLRRRYLLFITFISHFSTESSYDEYYSECSSYSDNSTLPMASIIREIDGIHYQLKILKTPETLEQKQKINTMSLHEKERIQSSLERSLDDYLDIIISRKSEIPESEISTLASWTLIQNKYYGEQIEKIQQEFERKQFPSVLTETKQLKTPTSSAIFIKLGLQDDLEETIDTTPNSINASSYESETESDEDSGIASSGISSLVSPLPDRKAISSTKKLLHKRTSSFDLERKSEEQITLFAMTAAAHSKSHPIAIPERKQK